MKLNNLQLGVLRFLRDDGPRSAYGLGAGLNTLNALALKKLVKSDRSRAGSFSTPRTSIKWEITDDGRQCVAHLDRDGLPVNEWSARMTDLKKQTEAAMKTLSDLSESAKSAGDGDLMCAANRAYIQLYNHQTVTLKEAIVKSSATCS